MDAAHYNAAINEATEVEIRIQEAHRAVSKNGPGFGHVMGGPPAPCLKDYSVKTNGFTEECTRHGLLEGMIEIDEASPPLPKEELEEKIKKYFNKRWAKDDDYGALYTTFQTAVKKAAGLGEIRRCERNLLRSIETKFTLLGKQRAYEREYEQRTGNEYFDKHAPSSSHERAQLPVSPFSPGSQFYAISRRKST